MEGEDPTPRAPRGPAAALARMQTGAKLFLILVVALLPLALIALFTTFQTTRSADREAKARLQVSANESSGVVANILASDVDQLGQALAALESAPGNAEACTKLTGSFADAAGTRFGITDKNGRVLCGQGFKTGATGQRAGQARAELNSTGLTLRIGGRGGSAATAVYPAATIGDWARPSGFIPEYGAALVKNNDRLTLRRLDGLGALDRPEVTRSDLDIDGLGVEMSMPGTPITSPLIITTVLLVLMWIAASTIAWFVVNVLLIRPLRRLQRSVGAYRPGEDIDIKQLGELPAQEIRDLGDTFREITRTVRLHESDLAEGLVRQTRLTREVHHRVKNNLQVIASLINFHARGAKSVEASEAYASIQRRVDALAVVHRHHYAEMEDNRGLDLRSVIGELAANIRATAPERAQGLGITLEIEPVLVNQDIATAVAFLLTEIVELAMNCAPGAQVRISVKAGPEDDRATLRVNSPALVESADLISLLDNRYGRILGGLARQLRTKLHHDPLVGAYEASIAITGRP